MADPLHDFLPLQSLRSLIDSSTRFAPNINALPVSGHIEDRRGEGITLADLAQAFSMKALDRPFFSGKTFPVTADGMFASDIENSAQADRMRSSLDTAWASEDAKRKLGSYFDAQEQGRQFDNSPMSILDFVRRR